MGLVALQHVGSSRTGARTHGPCTGRWILNHCATREVPGETFKAGLKTVDFPGLTGVTLVCKNLGFMRVSVLSLLILGIVLVFFIVPFLTSWFWFFLWFGLIFFFFGLLFFVCELSFLYPSFLDRSWWCFFSCHH